MVYGDLYSVARQPIYWTFHSQLQRSKMIISKPFLSHFTIFQRDVTKASEEIFKAIFAEVTENTFEVSLSP